MASKPVIKYTCDRCGRDYEEEPMPGADKKAKLPVIMIEAHLSSGNASPQMVRFDDLCTKCDSRVNDLIGQIALDDTKSKTADKSDQSSDPSLDDKTKASDNKGSKDATKASNPPS